MVWVRSDQVDAWCAAYQCALSSAQVDTRVHLPVQCTVSRWTQFHSTRQLQHKSQDQDQRSKTFMVGRGRHGGQYVSALLHSTSTDALTSLKEARSHQNRYFFRKMPSYWGDGYFSALGRQPFSIDPQYFECKMSNIKKGVRCQKSNVKCKRTKVKSQI